MTGELPRKVTTLEELYETKTGAYLLNELRMGKTVLEISFINGATGVLVPKSLYETLLNADRGHTAVDRMNELIVDQLMQHIPPLRQGAKPRDHKPG